MPENPKTENAPKKIPIRENLFVVGEDGIPKLICSRCKECESTFYPEEIMCPTCIKEGTLERVEVSGRGKIVSFTRVMRGLPGYDSPYALACIELDEGNSLIAQLQDWQDVDLKNDMPVELVIDKIKQEKDGTVIIGPKFKPASN